MTVIGISQFCSNPVFYHVKCTCQEHTKRTPIGGSTQANDSLPGDHSLYLCTFRFSQFKTRKVRIKSQTQCRIGIAHEANRAHDDDGDAGFPTGCTTSFHTSCGELNSVIHGTFVPLRQRYFSSLVIDV